MEYTNQDLYDFLLKIGGSSNPLYNSYHEMLNNLVNEGLDNKLSTEREKIFFDIMRNSGNSYYELSRLIYMDAAFRRVQKNEKGNYVVYPSLEGLPKTEDLLKYYCLNKKMSIEEIIAHLTPIIEAQNERLNAVTLEPYYGSTKYILLRTKAVYDAIKALKNRMDLDDRDLTNSAFTNISFIFNTMLDTLQLFDDEEVFMQLEKSLNDIPISKTKYDYIRQLYIEVLKIENCLVDVSSKSWDKYANENNGVFIHQLTCGPVESDLMGKICVSFYSNNANVITKYANGNTGYAYPMDIKSLFTISEEDVGSWQIDKERFIERGLPDNWQLDGSNMMYEYAHHTRLFQPEYIESEVLKNNCFAEAIIDNRIKKVRPLYCFYTADATEKQIEEITTLANKQGLELRYLDIKKEEVKHM